MPSYDTGLFDPPAPLAKVSLRNPDNASVAEDVPLLLDSGADVSLIPMAAALEIGVEPTAESYELASFNDTRSIVRAAHLELVFFNKTFRGKFLLYEQDCGVLGRDVLNLLSLVLNGPELTWDESKPV